MFFEWLLDALITTALVVLVLVALVISCAALHPPRPPR